MSLTKGVLTMALALFYFIQGLQGQEDEFNCREVVFNCDCGNPGYVFQAYFKQCHYWLPKEQACTRYQRCLECESGVDRCVSCPPNRYGRQCTGTCQCGEGQGCNRDTGQCEGKVDSATRAPSPPQQPSAVSCSAPQVESPVQQTTVLEQGILKAIDYSCPNSYILSGPRRINCVNGKWDSSPPRCGTNCEPPEIQPPLQQTVLPEGKAIRYSCPLYYILDGPETITCANGNWDNSPPRCRPMGCPRPGEIANGEIDRFILRDGATVEGGESKRIQLFQEDTVVVYECNPYYRVAYKGVKRCSNTGEWKGDDTKCVPECGLSEFKVPNIINGTDTQPGNWPWQAGLANLTDFIFCGGSLITELWVLTAAHCLGSGRVRRPPNQMKVFLGKYRRQVKDEHVQERSVALYEEHPHFTELTYDNDIALLLLDRPIKLTKRTLPVCLTTESISHFNVEKGREGVVTGWGRTETGQVAEALKRTYLRIISNEMCAISNSGGTGTFVVTPNMFCAGVPRGASDVCKGDSGGPMVFQDPINKNGRWYLEGIVSWGVNETCAIDGMYSGFTRVSRYLGWIDGQILRWSQRNIPDPRDN